MLAIACLSLAGTALAEQSVRIINNSKSMQMTLQIEKCTYSSNPKQDPICEPKQEIRLFSIYEAAKGPHYIDIKVQGTPGAESFVHVDSVDAIDVESKQKASGKYGTTQASILYHCTAGITGDMLVLDSMGTDIVGCESSSYGLPNQK